MEGKGRGGEWRAGEERGGEGNCVYIFTLCYMCYNLPDAHFCCISVNPSLHLMGEINVVYFFTSLNILKYIFCLFHSLWKFVILSNLLSVFCCKSDARK